ncbi:MAG TPA: hypothetical protein PKD73_17970, partial [Burkholderiaceae bacterium]|nr:hypothetical protein [Burkholderiaceae bacterium]
GWGGCSAERGRLRRDFVEILTNLSHHLQNARRNGCTRSFCAVSEHVFGNNLKKNGHGQLSFFTMLL